jgi:ketosteroid isomerase-like protein
MSATSKQIIARAVRVMALVLAVACARTPAVDNRNVAGSLRAEIEGINRQLEEAFNRKDMLAVASFYTDDAKLVGPRGQEIRGRVAIDAYWLGVRNPKSWWLEAFDIGGSRDEAYQYGRSTLVQEGTGGGPNVSSRLRRHLEAWL